MSYPLRGRRRRPACRPDQALPAARIALASPLLSLLQVNVLNALDKTYRSARFWWGAPYAYGEPRKVLLTTTYAF